MNIVRRFTLCTLLLAFAASAYYSYPLAAADTTTKDEPAKKEEAKKPDAKKTDAEAAVIAVFRLSGHLSDSPTEGGLKEMLAGKVPLNLKDLVERLQKAQNDKKVKAVVFTLNNFSIGVAQLEELRQAMSGLRDAGKEIYAYADSLSMGEYVLFAGATKLSVAPTGDVDVAGLHSESPYVRGLLDKLGVTPDFLTCGTYKSAAEMFTRESPSKESEEMTNWLYDGLYDSMVKLIASGRAMEPEKVRKIINDGPYTSTKAHAAGLIDTVQHVHEFEAGLKQRFDNNVVFNHKYAEKPVKKAEISLFDLPSLFSPVKKIKSHKDSVTIISVEGEIHLGEQQPSLLGDEAKIAASTTLSKILKEAAKDDSIKAVVLRIDSPGGSATASEIILAATKLVAAKKPLIVSMGNVAASGGYYVACSADTVFADELTITGSIGVVGGKMVTTEMWKKVGINWKEHSRGTNASLNSTSTTFNADQRKYVQSMMDEIYGVFKGHVTSARGKKLTKPIDDIAGGRVYTGRQALDLGLVDKIGTLDDAVKYAAKKAKLDKYEVRVLPEPKNFFEALFEDNADEPSSKELKIAGSLKTVSPQSPLIGAVLPHLQNLDPQRTRAVLRAFRQLEILRSEGVILMAPEYLIDSRK